MGSARSSDARGRPGPPRSATAAERLEERIEELAAELRLLVIGGEVRFEVARKGRNTFEDRLRERHVWVTPMLGGSSDERKRRHHVSGHGLSVKPIWAK
jgi:hypothetical protein